MNRRSRLVVLIAIAILFWPAILLAQYTLVLKNGRRITVQSYREEGQMIKIYGIGGEVGIPRDQIQSILKAGEEGRGLDLRGADVPEGGEAESSQEGQKQPVQPQKAGPRSEPGASVAPSSEGSPAKNPDDERAKEEEEYRKKVAEITRQLKAARERYSLLSGGSGGSDRTLLNGEDAIRARTDDLISRLRDVQHNPAGPSDAGGIKLQTPSPFTGQPPTITELRPGEVYNPGGVNINTTPARSPGVDPPPPGYTGEQKDLSDLRAQIYQLEQERQRLIDEMRQKNFDTTNLFLD